jgi:hypothetical protein
MRTVWVVKMTVYQVISMIAVRHCLMATIATVSVRLFMPRTLVLWRADVGISLANLNLMLLNLGAIQVMQVTVVKIVGMAVVLHRRVATSGTMLVVV